MAKSANRTVLTRREALILSATAGVSLAAGKPALASDSIKTAAHQEPGNCSTPRSAVAKTQYGKVRGFVDGGVLTFKGVPYGQTTAGENRWLPAKPPTPWTDEYPALVYGANCPQNLHPWTSIEQTFIQDWDDGWQSEDMLKLNIWTPSLTGKRPVMFYIHGGGFSFGSSYELPSHDGAQMARHHDVVQVSVNHRLNILGFFDVSEIGGSAYADSVNVGMTDLVAALQWVHDNIANFGGDPDRVMIYGQSGGGSKVTTLMGMPSAAGLFHRASAQSGGGGNIPSREQQKELARLVMKDLGLAPNDIASLQKMDWAKLNAAGNAAAAKINPPGPPMMGPGAPGNAARGLVAVRRWQGDQHAVVLRRRSGDLEERADADRLGQRRRQSHVFAPHRRGVACEPRQSLWRREGDGDHRRAEEGVSAEEHPDLVLHVQRQPGTERPFHAQQRREDGQAEARTARPRRPTRTTSPGRRRCSTACRRVAYGRTPILLRQHQALRTGNRQHTRGAGAGEEDGFILGGLCRNRQSEHAGLDVGSRPTLKRTRRWSGTTNAAWSTIPKGKLARSS